MEGILLCAQILMLLHEKLQGLTLKNAVIVL